MDAVHTTTWRGRQKNAPGSGPGRSSDSLDRGVGPGELDGALPVDGFDDGNLLQGRNPALRDGVGECAEDRLLTRSWRVPDGTSTRQDQRIPVITRTLNYPCDDHYGDVDSANSSSGLSIRRLVVLAAADFWRSRSYATSRKSPGTFELIR